MKTLRPEKNLKLNIWIITESVSTTNKPATMGKRSCVFVARESAASPVPIASDPVSPIKICAGAEFHHKKPRQAPAMAAEITARSKACGTSYKSGYRNCQNEITPKAPKQKIAAPAAKPSNPSVKLTAFADPEIRRIAHRLHKTSPISQPG